MNKTKTMKIWAGIFIATIMILSSFIVVTSTIKAKPPKVDGDGSDDGIIIVPAPDRININPVPPIGNPTCTVLWNRTWTNDAQRNGRESYAEPNRVTTDPDNNIYVCGRDNENQATIIKYDTDGNLQWNSYPDSLVAEAEDLAVITGYESKGGAGHINSTWMEIGRHFVDTLPYTYDLNDITYSSFDNTIVSCGAAFNTSLKIYYMYITKNDAETGNQLWQDTYTFLLGAGGMPIACALTTDESNGNIYLSGTALSFNVTENSTFTDLLAASGLSMKIGPNGMRHWACIDKNFYPGFTAYTGVDVDSSGYPFFSGYYVDITRHYNFVIAKRNTAMGGVVARKDIFRDNFWSVRMKIDRANGNTIYSVGGYGTQNKGIILKMTPSFDVIYETITDNNGNWFSDVVIKDSRTLVVASARRNVDHLLYLTLRPNGDSEKQLQRSPNNQSHFTAVDEEVANNDVDFLYTELPTSYVYDTFELPNHPSETKEIYSVTVYAKIMVGEGMNPNPDAISCAYKLLVQNTTVSYSGEEGFGVWEVWKDVNHTFTVNPETNKEWTWADIDNLKIGIAFIGDMQPRMSCTQLYCVVTYEGMKDQYTISLINKQDCRQKARFDIGDVHDYSYIDYHGGRWTEYCTLYVTATSGVAIDRNGDIVACGGLAVFDVIKCAVTTQRGRIAIPH